MFINCVYLCFYSDYNFVVSLSRWNMSNGFKMLFGFSQTFFLFFFEATFFIQPWLNKKTQKLSVSF